MAAPLPGSALMAAPLPGSALMAAPLPGSVRDLGPGSGLYRAQTGGPAGTGGAFRVGFLYSSSVTLKVQFCLVSVKTG